MIAVLRQRIDGMRRWPLWSLPRLLRCYVIVVILLWIVALVIGLRDLRLADWQIVLAVVLLCCGAASLEVSRKFGEPAGVVWRDMLGVWTLPLTLLLPPQFALLLAPLPLQYLWHLRVHRSLPHRLLFSIASIGLASGLGSWLAHTLAGPPRSAQIGVWLLVAVLAAAARGVVNLVLVAAAVKASDPEARWRNLLISREGLLIDGVQISAGLTIAGLCLVSPWLALVALPAMLFFQGSNAMGMQFKAVAYTDSKTGLLSAAAWEREANVAIARAHRAGAPLAVLMLDMDDFKRVNDTQGHLGGDAVLRLVALELGSQLRPDDLLGRFGGDEFAVLLPATTATEAYDVAERLRSRIAGITVPSGAGPLQVTVSVGMVTVTDPQHLDATELLTAADHALYRSKRTGRNRTSKVTINSDL